MTSTIKVDTISENTSANGITIDGVNIKDSSIATAGSVPLTAIDIDGGTDIGAAIVDADLFIVDDGAGGTNRKTTAARLKTYIGSFDADAAQVFNESGNDVDFRVESNGNANMLFVDGGNDCVNVGGLTVAGGKLNVETTDDSDSIVMVCTAANASEGPVLKFKRDNNNSADGALTGSIKFQAESDANSQTVYTELQASIEDDAHGSEKGRITLFNRMSGTDRNVLDITAANIVFNQDSQDLDFRVESDAEPNFFVIDAGNNVAGIGTTGSTIRFYIQNASNSNTSLAVQNTASDNASVAAGIDAVRAANSAYGFLRLNSSNGADVEFNFRGDGEAFADGSFSGGGADYAEYFEWKDGNSSNEDRIGYAVILDGTQIVKATDSDDASKIIGVISGNPAVVGDSAWNKWQEKHVKDDWNRYTYEDYTQTEWKDEDDKIVTYQTDLIPADVTVPDDAVVTSKDQNNNNLQRRVVNSNWDSTKTYVPRSDRKEWDTVGLMGKLRLRKGQPTGTNWIKMRDISDTVEEWLVK